MNILFIAPYVPNLIYVRPYNLIRNLVKRGHHVHLLTLISNEADRQAASAKQAGLPAARDLQQRAVVMRRVLESSRAHA